jgi:TetR/AcrR family transcriptional regulator
VGYELHKTGARSQYPGVPRLVFQELQHAKTTPLKTRVQHLMADYRTLIAQLLTRAREEGLLASEVDPASAVVLFMGAVQGLVIQSLVTGKLRDLASQGKAVFNLYEAGLLPKQRN